MYNIIIFNINFFILYIYTGLTDDYNHIINYIILFLMFYIIFNILLDLFFDNYTIRSLNMFEN